MKFEKPLTEKEAGYRSACLTCGPQPVELPLDSILGVGFGAVTVTRDGKVFWTGDDPLKELSSIEEVASKDSESDWRVIYYGPLSESEFQRQNGKWILIRKGMGFA